VPEHTPDINSQFGPPSAAERRLIDLVLAHLGDGDLLMTAAFEDDRAGTRLLSAARCSVEPPLVVVAARKGHSIEPLIRDSRGFAVCVIKRTDKLLARKFPQPHPTEGADDLAGLPGDAAPDERSDPFDALPIETARTGSPMLRRGIAALDCEVVRHFDLDADHELYVGLVLAARDFSGSLGTITQSAEGGLDRGEGI